MISKTSIYQFSSFKNIAKKTFDKFNTKYSANLQAFKQKVDATSSNKVQIQKSTQKPYVHPFHDAHHPVYPTSMKWLETMG
jgi:ABC-type Zn2+ transport system substrate-binding protein/surface adhesin